MLKRGGRADVKRLSCVADIFEICFNLLNQHFRASSISCYHFMAKPYIRINKFVPNLTRFGQKFSVLEDRFHLE